MTNPNQIQADVLTPFRETHVDAWSRQRDPGEVSAIVLPAWAHGRILAVGRNSEGVTGAIEIVVGNGVVTISFLEEVPS